MPGIPVFLLTLNCAKDSLNAPDFVQNVLLVLPSTPCDLFVFGFQEMCSILDSSFAELANHRLIDNNRVVLDTLKAKYSSGSVPYNFTTIGLHHVGAIGIIAVTPFPLRFRDCRFATASCGFFLSSLKGGVGLRTRYVRHDCEPVDLTFVSAHLAANEGEYYCQRRAADVATIMRALDFGDSYSFVKPRSHAFFMGDLNFRTTTIPNDVATTNALLLLHDHSQSDQNSANSKDEIEKLFERYDELYAARNRGDVFMGFTEPCVTFPPTYKFHPGTAIYTSKRSPLWCDRILFQSTYKSLFPKIHLYRSLATYMRSDHRPVYLHVTLPLDPPESIIGHNGNLMLLPSAVPRRHLEHSVADLNDRLVSGMKLQIADLDDAMSGPTSVYLKCTGIDKLQQLFLRRLSDAGIGYGLWFTTTPRGRITLLVIIVLLWMAHVLNRTYHAVPGHGL